MEIVHTHCAGLDVHKKTVVAVIIVLGPKRSWYQETRTFGTMTAELLASPTRGPQAGFLSIDDA